MTKIKEIIVVEGRDDTKRIQLAVDADTIETNGSAIDAATLDQIKKAQEIRGVIIFTDPDFPGEKIRKTIVAAVPDAKHAFLPVDEAKPHKKGSLGVEHASPDAIRQALAQVLTPVQAATQVELISQADLIEWGLINGPQAKKRRARLGEILRIGYTNGKQLKKRLLMFQVTPLDLKQAMTQVLEEEKNV